MTIVLLILAGIGVLIAVTWPLRGDAEAGAAAQSALRRADLEAEKEARYREIRDAELDRETGKVTPEDWRVLDRQLRTDAAGLLEEIDRIDAEAAAPER